MSQQISTSNWKSKRELAKLTAKIPGWLSEKEGCFLYTLARTLPPTSLIVEIGSWQGKSSLWLAGGAKAKEIKIFAVDPHIGSPEKNQEYRKVNTFPLFWQNIKKAGFQKKVQPILKSSQEAGKDFNRAIDLLFIDGSHLFKDVKNDFQLWVPKVKKGGWIVMHDATVLTGPWQVARDHLLFSSDFQKTGMCGSMIFGKYQPAKSASDKLKNRFINLLSYLFILLYVNLRKISFVRQFWQHLRFLINPKRRKKVKERKK